MSKKSRTGKFVLGAAVGATLGAVAGVLFAPKSGKETREDIKNKANDAKDFTVDKASEVKEFAVNKTNEVKKSAKKVKKNLFKKTAPKKSTED